MSTPFASPFASPPFASRRRSADPSVGNLALRAHAVADRRISPRTNSSGRRSADLQVGYRRHSRGRPSDVIADEWRRKTRLPHGVVPTFRSATSRRRTQTDVADRGAPVPQTKNSHAQRALPRWGPRRSARQNASPTSCCSLPWRSDQAWCSRKQPWFAVLSERGLALSAKRSLCPRCRASVRGSEASLPARIRTRL